MPPDWRQSLPNALTLLRLVLAAAFFVALEFYAVERTAAWPADLAVGFFVLAALTDAADGYLARRWSATSTFGRIMDPLCDKVLVLGAFVYLAAPRFVDPETAKLATGVLPWMVVAILFRELLVTSIRGVAESMGIAFGANWWGKWKMILQTIAIPAVLLLVAHFDPERTAWARWTRDGLVWATLIVTLASGLPYVRGFVAAARPKSPGGAA